MKTKKFIASIIALGALLAPSFVFAQVNTVSESFTYAAQIGGGALGDNPLQDVIVSIVNVMLSFTALIFTATIIYGGFLFHTSHANEEERNYAIATIRSGIIGIGIIISSMSISKFVLASTISATGGSASGLTF